MKIIPTNDAYAGQIGRLREEFCASFIEEKQKAFGRIQTDIFVKIEAKGESITCHKGCSVCCVLFVEAGIQECEAVVYYLYRNPPVLTHFLKQYGDWRAHMRRLGGAFALCEGILHRNGQERLTQVDQAMLLKALACYQQQNIPCSFLDGGECSIYEVRPYVCVNHYVTTPEAWCQAENWCNPDFPNRPRIYMTELEEIDDRSFYLGNLSKPVISFFQTTVYRILTGGLPYVAEIAGFEALTAGASSANRYPWVQREKP